MSNALVNYDEQWAQAASAYAANEPLSGGAFLSTKGGILSFQENPMPGNMVACIVIDSYRENTYYPGKFDADSPLPPTCYAFGRDGAHMGPHPSMQADLNYFRPENMQCEGCPRNEWGSADQGRGKACQNRRRLTLLPAGFYVPRKNSRDFDLELFADPTHFKTAEVAYLKLPVTSVNDWAKYVNQLSASVRRPPFGVVSCISLVPDPKTQFKLHFEMVEMVPDNLASIIMERHRVAAEVPFRGYEPPEANAPQAGPGRGLRR